MRLPSCPLRVRCCRFQISLDDSFPSVLSDAAFLKAYVLTPFVVVQCLHPS